MWNSRYSDGLRADGRGSIPSRAKFFSTPQRLDRLRSPLSLLYNGTGGFLRGVKLPGREPDHSQLEPRPILPNTS
jgi:hypothetical protein